MRVVFAGTPATALPTLHTLVRRGHAVVAVITRPDAPAGRHGRLRPSAVGQAADELGVPVLKPASLRDPAFQTQLRQLAPEVGVVVAYGALIPPPALAIPPAGWVNLHFSLLPRWRGAAPVQHALLAGDSHTGATTFRLVSELDAGPVYRQLVEPIGPDDTAGDLLDRLAVAGAALLADTLDDIAAGIQPVPQAAEGVTLAPKITPEDAHLDWRRPAHDLARLIAATSPTPGAWTTYRGERFKVLRAKVTDPGQPGADRLGTGRLDAGNLVPYELAPGQLWADRHRLLVGTGQGNLDLIQVQGFGRRPMSGADWARGAKPEPGDRCE